ncbi:hypothetical protein SFRURICE_017862 [Spodoptera frugiperda]|nr:hypothetical protein SFRURICE_017862 [Spodoptera frugiperda]
MTRKRHSLVDIESIDDIFRDLVKKRGFVKAKFTLFVKYVQCLDESQIKEAQKVELQERLQRSQLLFDKFSEIQDELDIIVSGSQVDKELEERELFENQYYAINMYFVWFPLEYILDDTLDVFMELTTVLSYEYDWWKANASYTYLVEKHHDTDIKPSFSHSYYTSSQRKI